MSKIVTLGKVLTSFAVIINPLFYVVGLVALLILGQIIGRKKGRTSSQDVGLSILIVAIFMIVWEIIYQILNFLAYSGGTMEEIIAKSNLMLVIAFVVSLVLFLLLELNRGNIGTRK